MDMGHTTAGYMFGFLMIEDNTGDSPEAVELALEALDKFSTSSIADPHCPNPGCQVMVFENRWEENEWMMSCSHTCWWRHEHRNFVRKFRGGFRRM
jgi:hypothetical protein